MSKIMDRNGRLFGKISVIDVLVVLVVVVMAAAIYVKNNALQPGLTEGMAEEVPITIVVEAENIPLYIVDAVRVGDQVFDRDRHTEKAIGTITSIEVLEAGKTAALDNGTYARMKNESARNLIITVEGSGTNEEGRCRINQDYEIGINAARNFCTNYTIFTGSVIEIDIH